MRVDRRAGLRRRLAALLVCLAIAACGTGGLRGGGNDGGTSEVATRTEVAGSAADGRRDPGRREPSGGAATGGAAQAAGEGPGEAAAPFGSGGVAASQGVGDATAVGEAMTVVGIRWRIPGPGLPLQADEPAAQGVRAVLLTFDDGPDLTWTPVILDALHAYGCRALWFVTGYGIGRAPWSKPEERAAREALLRRIHAEGHQVGTHTVSHRNLRQLPPEEQRAEIVPVNRAVAQILGVRPRFFRPPFGAYNDATLAILREEGMVNLLWSHGSLDWAAERMDPDEVVRNVLAEAPPTPQHTTLHAGAVVLMHDTHEHTARALPKILQGLKDRGYRCTLLPDPDPGR